MVQGLSGCRQVAGQVSAAVAYRQLCTSSSDQAAGAACLAKLDLPLLQASPATAGGILKVPAAGAFLSSLAYLQLMLS